MGSSWSGICAAMFLATSVFVFSGGAVAAEIVEGKGSVVAGGLAAGVIDTRAAASATASAKPPKGTAKKKAVKAKASKTATTKKASKQRLAGKAKRKFVGDSGKRKGKSKRNGKGKSDAAEARSKLDQTYKRSRGGGIVWNASGACLPASVRNAIYAVAKNFGAVVVNSTGRSRRHNRKVGGAGRSLHLQCRAADFRVLSGRNRAVLAFLYRRPGLGGIKLYRQGYFHIDNGPRRSWKG